MPEPVEDLHANLLPKESEEKTVFENNRKATGKNSDLLPVVPL